MSNIAKRLDELEAGQVELLPIFFWEDSPKGTSMPPNPEGRPVIVFRWARTPEEATPDPSNVSGSGDPRGEELR